MDAVLIAKEAPWAGHTLEMKCRRVSDGLGAAGCGATEAPRRAWGEPGA